MDVLAADEAEDQAGQEGGHQEGSEQQEQGQERIPEDILSVPGPGRGNCAPGPLVGVCPVTVFQVVPRIRYDRAPVLEDLDDVQVSADVAVLLCLVIVLLGILIGLLEPAFRIGEIEAVLQGVPDGVPIQSGEGVGVEQAAVQEGRPFRIRLLLQGRCQRERQGIRRRQRVRMMGRIHFPEAFAQQRIAAEARARRLQVAVGKPGLFLEGAVNPRHVLQGEGHVEGELRTLGIQEDRDFVDGLAHFGQLLPALDVVQQQGIGLKGSLVGHPQLLQQLGQGGPHVILGNDGTGRNRQGQQRRYGDQESE